MADIRAEVTQYRHPDSDARPSAPVPQASHTRLSKKPLDASIPIHKDSYLPATITAALNDLPSGLKTLFRAIKPVRRSLLPTEMLREIEQVKRMALDSGGSNGDDSIYGICECILAGKAKEEEEEEEALWRTLNWRERTVLQAHRTARFLNEECLLSTDMGWDLADTKTLSKWRVLLSSNLFG
jgi:hypothetical protein